MFINRKFGYVPILVLQFFGISIASFSQPKSQINLTIEDQNHKKITNGFYIIKDVEKETGMIIGGLPGADDLMQSGSIVKIPDGSCIIELDPSKPHYLYFSAPGKKTIRTFFPSGFKKATKMVVTFYDKDFIRDESQVAITTDDPDTNLWLKVYAMSSISANTEVLKYMDSSINYRRSKGTNEGFNYDLTNYYNAMLDIYHHTNNRSLKNYVLLNLSFLCIGKKFPVEEKYLKEAIKETPPSDYLWLAEGRTFISGCYYGLGGFEKNKDLLQPFYESLIAECPVESIKPALLYSLVYYARTAGIEEEVKYYSELVNDYPESKEAKNAMSRLPQQPKLSKGIKLPQFSIRSADDSTTTITNQSLTGNITLIDFWATWCGPCVAQLPNLEKAWQHYKDKGLLILGISMDKELKAVQDFRKKRFKMPWMNGIVGPDSKKISNDFEIFGIPLIILVDQNGTILSVDQKELEGDHLSATLKKVFSND